MKLHTKAALAGLAVCFFAGVAVADEPTAALTIEAKLFGSKTGTFSKDVLGPDAPPLGNVIIGEDASTSTFVTVRVETKTPLSMEATVSLVADELPPSVAVQEPQDPAAPLRKLLDKNISVPSTAATGSFYVGFWLEDTGCTPIRLTAGLKSPGAADVTTSADLNFACYE